MSHWEQNGMSDEWYTPKYIFDALECEFDLDVASPIERMHCNVPAKYFINETGQFADWAGFVWMNPPFGGRNSISLWLNKMYIHGNGIALTPDRTSCPWWQKAANQADAILFINGKVKFIKPNGEKGPHPSNGTTLFAYGKMAVEALKKAQINKLGTLLIRP